jgi:predicted oxidoreductase
MKTVRLGNDGPLSTRLGYGCMRIVHTWSPSEVDADRRAAGVRSIRAAYDAGYRHFDNADIYCHGVCEEVLGQAFAESPGMRDDSLVVSKCGVRFVDDPPGNPKTFDQTGEHIIASVDRSLKRMGIETIDLFLLHRPDWLMPAEEVAAAFTKLKKAGKVKHFGVSNFSIPQLDWLLTCVDQPIVTNQIMLHPGKLEPWTDGELWQLMQRGITPTAWSPVNRGIFADGGTVPDDADPDTKHRLTDILAALDDVAERNGVSRTVTTLAWLMRHPSGIIPIVGSTTPDHIADAAKADDFDMSRGDWYRILKAARGRNLP